MYEYFTEETKKILRTAEEEARSLRHSYIGTEHILLALLKARELQISRFLESFSLEYNNVLEEILRVAQERPRYYSANLDLTPLGKLVIRLAIEEAQSLGQRFVSPEHLLLGLLKCEEGVAATIFGRLGINLEQIQKKVRAMLLARKGAPAAKKGGGVTSTPMCDTYATDLSKKAMEGKLDPVIGRDEEIERVIHILSRRTKNNPCLIGDPGVGKTAIVEGLAQRMVENNVPETLAGKRLLLLNFSSIIAGAKFRGEFEERLKTIIDEIRESKEIVLFIDEIHTIVGTGASEGSMDAANILKPVLSRGELQVIGATTMDEYRKYIERDSALERRFQTVIVREPTIEETVAILEGLKERYEMFHRVNITREAIVASAKMAARYITGRFLPDKAIDLMDEACTYVRLANLVIPPDLKSLEAELEVIQKEEELAIANQDYEKAARMHCKDLEISAKIKELRNQWEATKAKAAESSYVRVEDVAAVVSRWTGIPAGTLTEDESAKLIGLEKQLSKRVIGQDRAISAVARAVRRARAGICDPRRPYASFLFLGMTGVGKTELAKALAEAIYGDENAMIRVDMSEYQEKHTVSRLVGAPPGYIGYDDAGQLTERIRRRPYSMILLDEIEKAHPDIFNVLLAVLEDGRLTDAHGRLVDFKNTIIIMTSNAGAREVAQNSRIGYSPEQEIVDYETVREKTLAATKKIFRPEFLNRIDEIVVFNPLRPEDVRCIAGLVLADLGKRLSAKNISLQVSESAYTFLVREGFSETMGARPLKRVIQQQIEDRIAEMLLEGKLRGGDTVFVDEIEGMLVFRTEQNQNTREMELVKSKSDS